VRSIAALIAKSDAYGEFLEKERSARRLEECARPLSEEHRIEAHRRWDEVQPWLINFPPDELGHSASRAFRAWLTWCWRLGGTHGSELVELFRVYGEYCLTSDADTLLRLATELGWIKRASDVACSAWCFNKVEAVSYQCWRFSYVPGDVEPRGLALPLVP